VRNTATKNSLWRISRIFCVALTALSAQSVSQPPRVYLWAWDRPEDLRFLDPEIGIAYFAGKIDFGEKKPAFRPRSKALLLPERRVTLPVLHVRAVRNARYGDAERELIVEAMRRLVADTGMQAIQLDFEVYHSQREFYKSVIRSFRKEQPRLRLSVTALASWCGRDSWLEGLAIDEVVPMLFDASHTRGEASGHVPQNSLCGEAAGLATYEKYARIPRAKNYYLFSNRAWRREDVTRMLAAIHEKPL